MRGLRGWPAAARYPDGRLIRCIVNHSLAAPPGVAAWARQGPATIYVRVTTANAGKAGTPQRAAVAGGHEANHGPRFHEGKDAPGRRSMLIWRKSLTLACAA